MCLVSGCVAASDGPTATIEIKATAAPNVQFTAATDKAQIEGLSELTTGPDLCALAAQLPADDVCSLICDPPAMADFLVAEGMQTGACYQLRCSLPTLEDAVGVGVCLSP